MSEKFVRGAERLKQRISTIRQRSGFTLEAAIEEFRELLVKRIKDRYLRGVDSDGNPWEPLAASTLKRKQYAPTKQEYRVKGDAGQRFKLLRTDALIESIGIIRGSAKGLFASSTGTESRIGVRQGVWGTQETPSDVISKYARLHQTGDLPRMPARPFLGIGRTDVKSADSFLRRRIKKLIEGANG